MEQKLGSPRDKVLLGRSAEQGLNIGCKKPQRPNSYNSYKEA